MKRTITFNGRPYTLIGRSVEIDAKAPSFCVVSRDLARVTLSDYDGKIKVITTFLSLDTGVCEAQLKEFNRRAARLSPDNVVLAVSRDLPFAQKRFCEVEGIANAVVLSDYQFASFGINYGVLIKELGLLSRAVFIIDKRNILRYIQLVGEVTQPPDYEEAFAALNRITSDVSEKALPDFHKTCEACEGGACALGTPEVLSRVSRLEGWTFTENGKVSKNFRFEDFVEAKCFVDLIAEIAQEQNHHPGISLNYNKVGITLWTHAVKGLTENDFILAEMIDEIRSGQEGP